MECAAGPSFVRKRHSNYHTVPVTAIPQPRYVIQADAYDLYCEQFQFWSAFPDTYKDNTPLLGPQSASLNCSKCKEEVETIVKTKSTTKTHIFAFTMCMFLLWPCCLFPYCLKGFKAREHICPKCGTVLGTFEV